MGAPSERLQRVLDRLHGVRPDGAGYRSLCPAHADREPSLSITEKQDGRILLYCHAGCSFQQVRDALGLTSGDLGTAGAADPPTRTPARQIVAAYDYRDERGGLLFQVLRYEPKSFRQRRPDGRGGWLWTLGDVRRVVYRLPEIVAADPGETVFICEGEKAVDRLAAAGLVAASSPGGATKWRAEYAKPLAGRDVVVLPDNDDPGRAHAEQVARGLAGLARSVRVLALPGLPEKGDVYDWLEAGHDAADLRALADAAPTWASPRPAPETPPAPRGPAPLSTTSADALLAAVFADPTWIVPGLVPVGLCLLAGRPKIGKSWLLLQLALAVGTGGVFLGERVDRRPVLVLALEDSPRRLKERMTKLGWPAGAAVDFVPVGGLQGAGFLSRAGGREALVATVAAGGYGLVIVDTLGRAVAGDFDSYADMTRGLAPLQALAQERNIAVVLADHHNKIGSGDPVLDAIGSVAKSGAADLLMALYKEQGKAGATLAVVGREVEETRIGLRFDGLAGCWQRHDAGGTLPDARQGILDILAEFERGLTIAELADITGRNKGTLYRDMQALVEAGRVIRTLDADGAVFRVS